MSELERCESTYALTLPDGSQWPSVCACSAPLGHNGPHMQHTSGGRDWTTWGEERAVHDRCPSLSPEPRAVALDEEPIPLRCARAAGHQGVHSMVVFRPYSVVEQVDWD